jgi:hypothetical protein
MFYITNIVNLAKKFKKIREICYLFLKQHAKSLIFSIYSIVDTFQYHILM